MRKTLLAMIYGTPGAGKTPIALTAPKPLLLLDAESGANFAAQGAVEWRPWEHGLTLPAEAEGAEVVKVFVKDFQVMRDVDVFLRSNPGRFKTVNLDSITEIQKRCKDSMGAQAFQGKSSMQDWGALLNQMEALIRSWRDLAAQGIFDVLVMTAIGAQNSSGFYGPDVQGALHKSLPGFVDVVGYMGTHRDQNGIKFRGMQIQGDDKFIAKDRTASAPNGGLTAAYGPVIPAPINITEMIERIYEDGQ